MTPADAMWPQPRPLPAGALLALGQELCQHAAVRHAQGEAGGVWTATRDGDGQLVLGPAEPDAQPTDDVRAIGRLLMEGALKKTPAQPALGDNDLVSHLTLVAADLPPSLLALLACAVAPDEKLRPADAVALWTELARAEVTARVRDRAPQPTLAEWLVAHDTHIGAYKSRLGQTNQDALFYQSSDHLTFVLVADGISISTAGSGNLASALLVQVAAARWQQRAASLQDASPEELDAFLVEVLASANQTVCEASLRLAGGTLRQHIPMGTTAVAALVRGCDVHLANLGDSRAYLSGPSGVALMTGDQNLRGEWLRSWQTPVPIALENEGHALVGYVGHFNVEGEPEALSPQLRRVRALPGETLLLCSDGLNDYAASSHAEMNRLIRRALAEEDLSAAARKLVEHANVGGGGDNVTVVLAQLGR